MKLYWSPRSPFVRKVMVCAHEIGIADRIEKIYTLVSMSSVNAEMLRANPLGRIPTLVTDDGALLYDSAAICEYLDARHGESRLFPQDDRLRWDALRRHALADGLLEMLVLWRGERTRPESRQSPDVLAAFEHKTGSALDAADAETGSHNTVDIGRITLGVALGYLDFRFTELNWRAGRARLAGWFETFAARPSMLQTRHEDERAQTWR